MKKIIAALTEDKRVTFFALFVVIATLIILYLEFSPKQFFLTISTVPASATISINNEYAGVGSIQKRLLAGTYTISTELEGYKPEQRRVVLNDTTTVEITLTPKEKTSEISGIQKAEVVGGVVSNDSLIIGINRFDSLLYQYEKSGATPLHDEPVASFDYQYPTIIFMEKRNSRDFIVLDVRTGEKRRASLRALEPLVSVGLIPNSNGVFFLGKLDTDSRTTALFSSDLSFLSPKEITTTKATKVRGLINDQALLYEEADGEDLSRLVITDVQEGKELMRISSNLFVISPNKAFVLSKDSKQLALYNAQTKQVVRATPTDNTFIPYFTSDNTPMRLGKTNGGIIIETLDPQTLASTSSNTISELGSLGVSSVIGQKDDLLILIDSTNKVWQIALP